MRASILAMAVLLAGARVAFGEPLPMRAGEGRAASVGALPPAAPEGGYLSADRLPDVATLLGPPPSPGSGTQAGDDATFTATRALQGQPRWALATRDAVFGADALLADFSCALGVSLTPQDAPALQHLLSRAVVDSERAESQAKRTFRRPRPFVTHPGAICVAREPWLVKSYSYPSGHSTFSWMAALILSEADPARSGAILARARVYGESRVVCGVHYESDVQAGRVAASAVFSALQASPDFQRDLQAVRVELAGLMRAGSEAPDSGECRVEAEAVAHPVW